MENEQFTTEEGSRQPTAVSLEASAAPLVPKTAKLSRRWLFTLFGVIILFVATVSGILYKIHNASLNNQDKSQTVKTQSIDLSELSSKPAPFAVDSSNRVVINGQSPAKGQATKGRAGRSGQSLR